MDLRKPALLREPAVKPEAEPHRLPCALSANHDGVADTLDQLGAVLRRERRDLGGELDRDLCRDLVALPLGERRVAAKVREEEALERLFGHSVK
jgi:hypothetical protein